MTVLAWYFMVCVGGDMDFTQKCGWHASNKLRCLQNIYLN